MEYSFSGKITLMDYIQFNKFHYEWPKVKLITRIFLIIVFVFLIISLIFNLINYNYKNKVDNFLSEHNNPYLEELINTSSTIGLIEIFFPLIIYIILLLILLAIDKIMDIRIYKKYYDSNKMLHELQNFTINNEKIIISSDSGNATITKEKICKIRYDNNSIYLYIGLNMAYIIKSHYFENENIFKELTTFIKENYMT